jgi:hypothetical protein
LQRRLRGIRPGGRQVYQSRQIELQHRLATDTLITRAAEYRASAIVDPHQAILIAQEAREAGVEVHEFPFTAASVGRLALSLHQAIRNHRIALPDENLLLAELGTVRLRKNSLGIYRLDHDAGQHDDQAIALALGTHYLLDADPEPEFTILSGSEAAQPGQENAFGIEVLQSYGAYAVRPAADDPWAETEGCDDEDAAQRKIVRTVRTVG